MLLVFGLRCFLAFTRPASVQVCMVFCPQDLGCLHGMEEIPCRSLYLFPRLDSGGGWRAIITWQLLAQRSSDSSL
ncbi:hypothetical protein B0I37DRAFT_362029, partial [Chaetomium sp. MPI-CAGE-AT-0009]